MFKQIIDAIKNFFADDPADMGPEELVALVANRETPEAQRRDGVEALSEISCVVGDIDDDDVKGQVSNKAYSTLLGMLARNDEPEWVIEGAIKGMNEIANVGRYDMDVSILEGSVDPLITHLASKHADGTRTAACSALASIDEKISEDAAVRAVDAVAEVMRQDQGEVRAEAIFSLGSFDSDRTGGLWTEVSGHLEDPSVFVRRCTASALWMIGNDEPDAHVIDRLIALLGSESDQELCDAVVDALGNLGKGHPGVVPALSDALNKEHTRHMAIFALSSLEEEADPAVPKLVVLLDDEEHSDSAVMALQGIGTESARAALRAAGHPEEM